MLLVPAPLAIVAPVGTIQLYETAPATAATEYVMPVLLQRPDAVPVITPGFTGAFSFEIQSVLAAQLTPKQFDDFTEIVPVVNASVTVIVIAVVPWPDVIEMPVPVTFQA